MAKYSIEDSVPPIMPINWADWEGDLHVQKMRKDRQKEAELIYFRLLLKQWYLGTFPTDAWELSQLIGVRYRTLTQWLYKYAHLFRCNDCNGILWNPKWGHKVKDHVAVKGQRTGSKLALVRQCPGSCLAANWYCTCTKLAVSGYNLKLRNYRKDVTYSLPLGTTESNITEPNRTEGKSARRVEPEPKQEPETSAVPASPVEEENWK